MQEKSSLKAMEDSLVNRLLEVKEVMNKQRDDLEVSIRKDVLAVELKDLLDSHSSFYSLKNALEEYIKNLYKNIEVVDKESEEGEKDK